MPCEKQKRKLVLVLPYQYTCRKYPISSSNSPINFTKLPIVLSRTYAIQVGYSTASSFTPLIATDILEMISNRSAFLNK